MARSLREVCRWGKGLDTFEGNNLRHGVQDGRVGVNAMRLDSRRVLEVDD